MLVRDVEAGLYGLAIGHGRGDSTRGVGRWIGMAPDPNRHAAPDGEGAPAVSAAARRGDAVR
jgi:hypothetical protein